MPIHQYQQKVCTRVYLLGNLISFHAQVVAEARSSEAFVALCLLTVAGTSLLTQQLGFSDTVRHLFSEIEDVWDSYMFLMCRFLNILFLLFFSCAAWCIFGWSIISRNKFPNADWSWYKTIQRLTPWIIFCSYWDFHRHAGTSMETFHRLCLGKLSVIFWGKKKLIENVLENVYHCLGLQYI